jgi:hypothetical protein
VRSLRIEATVDPVLDVDGLLAPEPRAQLVVLRSLAGQYGADRLIVTIRLVGANTGEALSNAMRDLDDVYPGVLHFESGSSHNAAKVNTIRLLSTQGNLIEEWHGFQNAATLGGAVRARLGPPDYSHMQPLAMETR